eukprot:g76913.t1
MSSEEPPKKKRKKERAEKEKGSTASAVVPTASAVVPTAGAAASQFMDRHQASYQTDANGFAVIAQPMAGEKLTKKCLKLIKKGKEAKCVHRGVKEVVKALRKDKKGIVLLAANISPIDVLSHVPGVCEAKDVPYIWLPSKEDIGAAALTKRASSVMLVVRGEQDGALHNKILLCKSSEVSLWIAAFDNSLQATTIW